MADDDIILRGVPFFPGGRVPDGWTTNIEEIAAETDATPQEVAESMAESAIERVYDSPAFREEEEGVREVYKQMLDEIRTETDRQGIQNVRRSFYNIVSNDHSAVVEQQAQAEEEELDPEKCQHVKDNGEQCNNPPEEGSDYCHVESHGPDEEPDD